MAKDDKDTPEEQSDRQEQVFMREVDDAVREDDLKNFGRRYGIGIGVAVVVGLASLAGWIFYNNSLEEESGLRSEEYVAAIDSVKRNNLDGAATALESLEEANQEGYKAAAKLMQANIALEKQDAKAAIAGYQAIVADSELPQPFRDLALIRQTTAEFDTLEPQAVIDRLKPLAVPGNPWFGSAGEMVALSYLNLEKTDLAGPLFAQLAKDDNVPPTIRSRALQMAGVQGIDAVELDTDGEINPAAEIADSAASEGETE
ncbi:tetratricopeptide repeat protein [Sphingorhabdus sp. EL138]|uniref:tetratricopeptide repeat protein n=1 Tax=Sphingorhabdus sp. EL138 TaxID=2073156 RepID=UPI0020B147E1|nr:tetratricopeptide repeat protein [Sphingorhabdus sp. EL138]